MWASKQTTVLDLFPIFQKFHILSINQNGLSGTINSLFWCCVILSIVYFYFNRIGWNLLQSQRIQRYKIGQTIRCAWNVCFFAASIFFLCLYRKYFLLGRIEQETERLFPKYKNSLFALTDNCSIFNSISLIFLTYYVSATVLDLKQRDYSEARSKVLYTCLLICLNTLGYENYFVLLNIIVGLFQLFSDCLLVATLHMADTTTNITNTFFILKITAWSYIFLTLLPFNYLVPTLYSKSFKLWLNTFLWFWYGSCVWNSPILNYIYHQIYHQNSNECMGENSFSRCILLKDFPEWRHYKNLQQAVIDVHLAKAKETRGYRHKTENNASATTFQTIKCIIALKRKLRRIRENNQNDSQQQQQQEDSQT